MTPVILLLALAFVGLGGLSLVAAPLIRDSTRTTKPPSQGLNENVRRALDLMDDLDNELALRAISAAEHAEQTTELRVQASIALETATRHRARATAVVDGLLAGNRKIPTATVSVASPPAPRRPVVWIISATTLVVALVAVVLLGTLGARRELGQQTIVGNAGVTPITAIAASPREPDVLALSHPAGIQVSRDGGTKWQAADFPHTARSVVAIEAGLLAITDDGQLLAVASASNWVSGPSLPNVELLAAGRHSARLIGVDTTGTMHESFDAGFTWQVLGLSAPSTVTGIAVVVTPEPLILLSTSTQGVLASTKRNTWRSANGFVKGALPTVNIRSLYYEPDSGDIHESPTGQRFEGAVYVATDSGLFKTIDGMQTWTVLPLSADIVAITGSPADTRLLYAVARDGSVFRSRNAGASWS